MRGTKNRNRGRPFLWKFLRQLEGEDHLLAVGFRGKLLFLPSYGELDEARFRVSGKGTLALDGTVLTDGMSCGGLALDKPTI